MFNDKNASDINVAELQEAVRISNIISRLEAIKEDKYVLGNAVTDILLSDTVVEDIAKLTKNSIFAQIFPELYEKNDHNENVINCQQNSKYHKYGVFMHILNSIENVCDKDKPYSDNEKRMLKWTMLLHDIGKPYVKEINGDYHDSFFGHEELSEKMARDILPRFDFTTIEINEISKLILNHDKFLRLEEATYDNFMMLLDGLEHRKDLFYLLFDVKKADAMAKNDDAYEVSKLVREEFLKLAEGYFDDNIDMKHEDIITHDIDYEAEKIDLFGNILVNKEEEYKKIINQMILKQNILNIYQPIIDINNMKVYGYEIFSRAKSQSDMNIAEIIEFSKDINAFEKLQQSLFVNAVDKFSEINQKEADKIFINMDLKSFENYTNKPRVRDMMHKFNIILELKNYDTYDIYKLETALKEIKKLGGYVLLDNYRTDMFSKDDIDTIKPDYIKVDLSSMQDFENVDIKQNYLNDIATFCYVNDMTLIVGGVQNSKQFRILKDMKIDYLQGYYLANPNSKIEPFSKNAKAILKMLNDESIV